MMAPNTMCRPPNPAAMHQLPNTGGTKSATTPTSMKHSPITGTIRTENVPAVATPAPYDMSQVVGSSRVTPARYSATVRRPPTTMGGRKLRPKRRAGPERIGSFAAWALRASAQPPITSATTASASQVASHSSTFGWRAASNAAASAVAPTATCPHPGTAVKAPARSIVSLMKRRLSIARSWSGCGCDMSEMLAFGAICVKYFTLQSRCGGRRLAPQQRAQFEASRQDAEPGRVACASWRGPIDQHQKDPGQPAHPLRPAERTQHEPALRVGRGPRQPLPLQQHERPHQDAVRLVPVRAGARQIPQTRHLAPPVIVAPAHDQQVVLP